jgi:uncharacterized membrane-anchored protein YjiN (DUF445 family)
VQRFIGQAWKTVKKLVLDAAADPSSALRLRVRDGLLALGARLSADAELRGKIDGWLVEAAGYIVRHYRREITTLITDTVARWDAAVVAQGRAAGGPATPVHRSTAPWWARWRAGDHTVSQLVFGGV